MNKNGIGVYQDNFTFESLFKSSSSIQCQVDIEFLYLTCKCLTRLWNIKFSPVKGERGSYTKVFEKRQAVIFISVTSDI